MPADRRDNLPWAGWDSGQPYPPPPGFVRLFQMPAAAPKEQPVADRTESEDERNETRLVGLNHVAIKVGDVNADGGRAPRRGA